jgi:hypothetical protein
MMAYQLESGRGLPDKVQSSLRFASILFGAIAVGSLSGCSGADSTPATAHVHEAAPTALAAIYATPEGVAKTGIALWELYDGRTPASGFNVIGRDANRKIRRAMNVQVVSQSSGNKQVRLTFTGGASALVDAKLGLVESTLTSEHAEFGKYLSDALNARGKEPYGCVGDIFWAVGGLIGTIGACGAAIPGIVTGPFDGFLVAGCVGAFLGGAVAGTVSAYEDCGSQGSPSITETISYTSYYDDDQGCWASMDTGECMGGGS